MMKDDIMEIRRQHFIDGESYSNTLKTIEEGKATFRSELIHPDVNVRGRVKALSMLAPYELWIFQLKFTAGVPLFELAGSLDGVIHVYEEYVKEIKKLPEIEQYSVFDIEESMDDYVDYLNFLSAIILLRRADLLPRAAKLLEGTPSYQQDIIVEMLLRFYISNRPLLGEGLWQKPYQLLLDAIEADCSEDSSRIMKKYVKRWYPSMKGQASFWGKHEHITPEYSSYQGYWAMCAAAFTYLYELDDSGYRDEIVYPRDLIDYARSLPSDSEAKKSQLRQLRVLGGHPCTRAGYWMTPASSNSRSAFQVGDIMPVVAHSSYGTTIWQWVDEQ